MTLGRKITEKVGFVVKANIVSGPGGAAILNLNIIKTRREKLQKAKPSSKYFELGINIWSNIWSAGNRKIGMVISFYLSKYKWRITTQFHLFS